MMQVKRVRVAHHGRGTTAELARVRGKCTKRHLVHRGGDKGSVWIAVHRAMIDAEDTCLAVEEGVWTWI